MWHTIHINKRKIWSKSSFSLFCCVPVVQQSSYVEKILKVVSQIIFYQNNLFAHTWHASKPYLKSWKLRFQKYWWNPHFFVAQFVHFVQRKNAGSTSTFESIFSRFQKKVYFCQYSTSSDMLIKIINLSQKVIIIS